VRKKYVYLAIWMRNMKREAEGKLAGKSMKSGEEKRNDKESGKWRRAKISREMNEE